jgi:hypothetical protein
MNFTAEASMGWSNVAAGLGTEATVSALKAAEGQVSKRKYKRLIATAVAQLLELHPDIGPRKARRRARRLTGARPSKKLLRATKNLGFKEGAEGLVAAAATAGIAKVAGVVGDKLKEKFSGPGDEATNGANAERPSRDGDRSPATEEAPSAQG